VSLSPTSRAGSGLAIGLCPEAVGIVRLGGWRHARVDGQELLEVAEPSADGMAALTTLEHWLQQNRRTPAGLRRWFPAPANVVLSDRLVRYARIPWAGGALSRNEEDALILACFEERYGDMSAWTVRSETGRYGDGQLAAAVPSMLMAGLHRVLQAHRLACRAVSPYFVACWNRWRRDIAKANGKVDAMFAVTEAGTTIIGTLDAAGGGWRSLRSLRAASSELPAVLAREAVLLSLPERPATWVHSPQSDATATAGGNIHVLSTSPGLPAVIVMALSAVGQ